VGFFTMLIVGVSYKLVPMFTLSEVQSRRRAVASVILLNLGLAGSFVTILRHSPLKPVFALMVVAALAAYGWELKAILRARKRRALDWGIKYFLTAIVLLLPLSVLAVVLSWPGLPQNILTGQLENLYGFLGLIGVITFAIIGMLYKISITGQKVTVVMTLTTPGCPMHESIRWGAQQALLNLAGVEAAEVEVVWDPPWHPSMMTEFGREATGVGSF
jgi:metal-sulfur cluster biosynthetic enzyme